MAKANEFITGPGGAWINAVLLSAVLFFSSQLYADFKNLTDKVIQNMSDDRVQEYRITVLEKTK